MKLANRSLEQGPEKVQVTYLDAAGSTSLGFSLLEHEADSLRAWQILENTQPLTILLMWINKPNKTKTKKTSQGVQILAHEA